MFAASIIRTVCQSLSRLQVELNVRTSLTNASFSNVIRLRRLGIPCGVELERTHIITRDLDALYIERKPEMIRLRIDS